MKFCVIVPCNGDEHKERIFENIFSKEVKSNEKNIFSDNATAKLNGWEAWTRTNKGFLRIPFAKAKIAQSKPLGTHIIFNYSQ